MLQTLSSLKKWFGNLKVSQKLTLIGVFFLIPDSVMLYLFITGINANIQFARLEKMGNEYQRPLESLLELIPQHRLLTLQSRLGDPAPARAISASEAEIDRVFVELEAIDARIGTGLQFTEEGLAKRKREHFRPRIAHAEWDELKRDLPRLNSAEGSARHAHLIADIRTMITHAGDMSNLILDPDLDSYYLMDTTLLALPQNQDRMAAAMASAATALTKPELNNADRQQFAVFETLLKEADLSRISKSMQVALVEDPNFYGVSPTLQERLPPALRDYENATNSFIELTQRLHTSSGRDVSLDEYLAAGRRACDASFRLWRIADAEVDTLLQNRIDYYLTRRARSLLVTAFALLAATGFVTFITRSISGPLRAQAAQLQQANTALEAEIAERKRAEEELLIASRQAGMAEVATGVLHNVGNVLNSVNVSAMLISERLSKSRITHLANISTLLSENSGALGDFLTTHPKGRMLPNFIQSLSERLGAEQAELLREVEGLTRNIGHIKDIVSVQQGYAKGVSGLLAPHAPVALVEDALHMNSTALERHGIEVVRLFDQVPPVLADKHKVLQILINLIRNAKQAMSSVTGPKLLTVRVWHEEEHARVSISDTGIGIAPEHLARVFAFGFTTRSDGHGFGLHSSALAATEMGGSLTAASDGPERGATFTLSLPVEKPARSSGRALAGTV